MSEPTGAEGPIEEFETELFRSLERYFEVRRRKVEESIERVGTEFKNFQEARRQQVEFSEVRGTWNYQKKYEGEALPGEKNPALLVAGRFWWLLRPHKTHPDLAFSRRSCPRLCRRDRCRCRRRRFWR
jgi:hypothetical protein